MGEYQFALATQDDDPEIRRLLARNPVPGDLSLTYLREPDYFRGCTVMGETQVLTARHTATGELAAIATRSIRPHFVNGEVQPVGYIGQLRVDRAHRGRWIVPLGFRFFHDLHQDGQVQGYVTTIIEGNAEAEGLLVTRARRHLPAYRAVDRLSTLAIVLHRRHARRAYRAPGVELTHGTNADLPAVIAFLQREGRRKQFAPVYREADFGGNTTRDFAVSDLLLAHRDGELVGVLGLWDQSGFKQTVVDAISAGLRRLRPFYNAGARLIGTQPLAGPGDPIHSIYGSFVAVAADDPAVFRTLLDTATREAATRGFAFLTLGLSVRDPLYVVARRYRHFPYFSTVYTVCWQGDEAFHDALDGRPVYLELGTL